LGSPFLHPSEARPFLTADRITKLDARRFVHLGRSDGVVKVAGVRVSLAEVEQKLLGIEGVTDAAALAVEVGGPRGQQIWAAYASDRVLPEEARAALLRWLSPVAAPRRLLRVPASPGLPRSPNGKLPRAALLELFGGSKREEER
jgi:acyl-coenzyme A synthetase/AMP-(fatty) acid ligase